MKIVVDTNIVFSAVLNSQSWIGHILLNSGKKFKFYSPRFLLTEIQNHRQKIKTYTSLSDAEIDELLHALYARITFISEELSQEKRTAMAGTKI